MVVPWDPSVSVSLPKRLRGRYEDHLYERDQLAEDEPEVDVLDVGRLGQGLHHRDENCRQDQHVGQVYSQSSLKEKFLLYLDFFGGIFKLFLDLSKLMASDSRNLLIP